MGVNGESMGKRWPKETHVLELITGAPWLPVAQLENRYFHFPDHPQTLKAVNLRALYMSENFDICTKTGTEVR